MPSFPTSHFFFFNDTATTEIYTLSLHDALPISSGTNGFRNKVESTRRMPSSSRTRATAPIDRKSTRLNSSHQIISYAVFCLKKKKNKLKHSNRDAAHDTLMHQIRRCSCTESSRV